MISRVPLAPGLVLEQGELLLTIGLSQSRLP
jgi:hypothetical protein